MPVPYRTRQSGRSAGRGHVGHGRPGTARVTGARAIISPRLVVAPGRGGLRGRVWPRFHQDDAQATDRGGHDPDARGTGDPAGLPPPPDEGHDAG